MIDSLIDLRMPVPATNLKAISLGFPVEGVILMMQSPRDNVELLLSSRQRKPDSNVWIAASNALVKMRSPKIALALLREVPFRISIELSDDGEAHPWGLGGSSLGGVQEQALPSDFPPVSLYQLVAERAPGDEIASDGPVDIYERRFILTPGQNRTWAPLPEIQPKSLLAWKGEASFRAAVTSAVRAQQLAVWALVRRLRSFGLVTTCDCAAPVRLTIVVEDHRTASIEALPVVSDTELSLQKLR